jgi:hypothetical protein
VAVYSRRAAAGESPTAGVSLGNTYDSSVRDKPDRTVVMGRAGESGSNVYALRVFYVATSPAQRTGA